MSLLTSYLTSTMVMRPLNFPKIKKRKLFTKIFGGAGKRRYAQDFTSRIPCPITRKPIKLVYKVSKRFKMQWVRRSHQGWRNRIYGSAIALKLRLEYGRRKPTPQFRR